MSRVNRELQDWEIILRWFVDRESTRVGNLSSLYTGVREHTRNGSVRGESKPVAVRGFGKTGLAESHPWIILGSPQSLFGRYCSLNRDAGLFSFWKEDDRTLHWPSFTGLLASPNLYCTFEKKMNWLLLFSLTNFNDLHYVSMMQICLNSCYLIFQYFI